jgi:hypothetical protein
MKTDYLDKGESKAVADEDSFKSIARQMWQYKQPKQTASSTNTESFTSYVRTMKKQLRSHGFTRPFHLLKGPREQDEWTTWDEYLNYIYWEIN